MLDVASLVAGVVLGVSVAGMSACGGNVVVDGTTSGAGGATSGGPTSTGSTSSGASGDVVSRNEPSDSVCYSFPASVGVTTCPEGSSVSSCPTANVLGSCTVPAGGTAVLETYYSGGQITASAAESACDDAGGVWDGQ